MRSSYNFGINKVSLGGVRNGQASGILQYKFGLELTGEDACVDCKKGNGSVMS